MWSRIMTRLLLACCVAVTLYTGQSAGTCREDVFQPQKFKCRDWEDLELIYNKTLIEELIIENPWPFRCDYAAFVLYPRLKYLRLPKGSLMYVGRHCFDGLKQITEIDLKNNDVEEFHFESLNNSTISFLTLTGNILRSLALDGIVVPRLRHLIVAKNQLETLYVERSNFPEIIDISADNNHMHTFFVTSDVLHTLRLSENDIVAFGPEHLTAPRLEYLLLQNNRIRKISVDSFQNIPRIQEISLEGNPLEVVDFSYGNITDFSIHENRLIARKAEWENTFAINLDWRFVQQLRFSHNDIRSYNLLRRLDNGIQELNLDHNKLRKIGEGDVATFTNLFVLDLSHNRIASIHYEAFDRLHRLHTLKLNNNCLQSLSGALFDSLNSLTNINLDTNLLTYFPIPGWNNRTNQIKLTEYHPLLTVQEIMLANNPLQCPCYEMMLGWIQTLQHYELLRHKLYSNSRLSGCMETKHPCQTYFTQRSWSALVPSFIRSKNGNDLYGQCDYWTVIPPVEPRRILTNSVYDQTKEKV